MLVTFQWRVLRLSEGNTLLFFFSKCRCCQVFLFVGTVVGRISDFLTNLIFVDIYFHPSLGSFFFGKELPSERAPSMILNHLNMHSVTSLSQGLEKMERLSPPLAWTQQPYGEKVSFAWTGNFQKMPHTRKQGNRHPRARGTAWVPAEVNQRALDRG